MMHPGRKRDEKKIKEKRKYTHTKTSERRMKEKDDKEPHKQVNGHEFLLFDLLFLMIVRPACAHVFLKYVIFYGLAPGSELCTVAFIHQAPRCNSLQVTLWLPWSLQG